LVVDLKKHIDPLQAKAGIVRAKRAVDAAPIAAIFLNIIIFTPFFLIKLIIVKAHKIPANFVYENPYVVPFAV